MVLSGKRKLSLFVNKCERNYLDPPDSAIFEMFMFTIKDKKNTIENWIFKLSENSCLYVFFKMG